MGRKQLTFRDDVVYLAFRAFMAGAGSLPLALTRPVIGIAGRLAMALNRRDRRRSRTHLRIAFPELEEGEIRSLLRANARHFGMVAAELAWLGSAAPAQVLSLCSASGSEHLRDAVNAGNGATLVTGHCGNWEMLNAWLGAAGFPMTIAVRDIYDERLHMPRHEKTRVELISLEDMPDKGKGKIDHPPRGSKDCSDAVAGVVLGLVTRRETYFRHGVSLSKIPESVQEVLARNQKMREVEQRAQTHLQHEPMH